MADINLTPNGPRLIFSDPDDSRAPIEYDLRDINRSYVHGHIYRGELKECVYVGMPKRTANRKHPLFTLALEAGSSDNPSTSQVFARFFLTMLNMSEFHEFLSGSKLEAWHGIKQLGHLFGAVDWTNINQGLHPPYKIWLPQIGHTEITEEHFRMWTTLEIPGSRAKRRRL